MLSNEEKTAHIKKTELFSSLSESEILPLAHRSREDAFPPGTVIFREKETGSSLYVVIRGRVSISKGGIRIGEALEGDAFGEMALLDDGMRSASAMAATEVDVLCIDRDDFLNAASSNWQMSRKVFKILSGIIRRQSDSYISRVVEQEEAVRKMHHTLQLNKYMEIGKALTSSLNVRDILSTLLERVGQIIQARGMLVFMLDRQKKELFLRDSKGFGSDQPREMRIRMEETLGETVCNRLTPIVIEDIHSSRARQTLPQDIIQLIQHSALFVPLKIREKVTGFLGAIDVEDIRLFREDYRPFLDILADYVSVALANATNFETIDRLSVTDDVTGFYNTRFLHRHLNRVLAEAERKGKPVSLVFFDLDNFKRTVDAHGHLLGSKVLKEVAECVNGYLDAEDRVVRYGGDEYILILPSQDKDEALSKVQKIKDGMARTRFLRKEQINEAIKASFGIATFPQDASDKDELLRAADHYMYDSKRSGKNRITYNRA